MNEEKKDQVELPPVDVLPPQNDSPVQPSTPPSEKVPLPVPEPEIVPLKQEQKKEEKQPDEGEKKDEKRNLYPTTLNEFIEDLPDPKEKDDGKLPKGLWISQDPKIIVTIYAYKNVNSGEMTHVTMEPISDDRKRLMAVVELPITAEFRIPDHRQLDNYRERYSKWSDEAQALLPNRYNIRRVLIRNHMDKIDLVNPETGSSIQLKHDKAKRLTPESEAMLDRLHPTILDLLMLKYERMANLVY